jgi:hypothetical protein
MTNAPTTRSTSVLVEFNDLTHCQRSLVDGHPRSEGEAYRHGGLPVRWVASFECRPGCDPDQLFLAVMEWARYYGLPLRRRIVPGSE